MEVDDPPRDTTVSPGPQVEQKNTTSESAS